ncbi:MAG: hypothetical protein KF763_13190 [Cyclobacteriaceae bacterium]|nr:hypothetical protein [Cyclobacteriaceae bacterium]
MTNESLISQLASIDRLKNAWGLLNKENEDSYGFSGKTIKDFSQDLDSNLTKLSEVLLDGSFRFSPTRAAIIKKDNGEYRPLQIPEVKDRVVLKALAILLEEQLDTLLSKSEGVSFAYQQGKGVREAILQMKANYLQGGKVILKADIVNFFEEVKKDKLLNELIYPNLRDKTINKLIADSMSQKLKLKRLNRKHWGLFKNAGKGIPQGNPLSPLLSNIYLSKFDIQLKEAGYSLIRYADDFIVIFSSEEEAKEGYEKLVALLRDQFSLKIHALGDKNEKTKIVHPAKNEFSFLSVKFDGENVYPGHETVGYLKHIVREIVKKGQLNSQLFASIYDAIEKWIAIYSYLDIERYFDEIDSFVKNLLIKKFGKKRYKITTCSKLAHRRRAKQYDKNKKSFWRNPDLTGLLPNFIRHRFVRNPEPIEASLEAS